MTATESCWDSSGQSRMVATAGTEKGSLLLEDVPTATSQKQPMHISAARQGRTDKLVLPVCEHRCQQQETNYVVNYMHGESQVLTLWMHTGCTGRHHSKQGTNWTEPTGIWTGIYHLPKDCETMWFSRCCLSRALSSPLTTHIPATQTPCNPSTLVWQGVPSAMSATTRVTVGSSPTQYSSQPSFPVRIEQPSNR